MKKNRHRMGIFQEAFYNAAIVDETDRLLNQFHAEGKAIPMPVRRKVVSLQSRLIEIEMILRRAAWPKMSDMDAFTESERILNGEPEQWATPQQRESWRLVRLVACLREMLRATSPDSGTIASLSLEIGMGLVAVAGENPDIAKILQSLTTEQREANEINALALRHAGKMEEVARDAVANPLETALDIYQRLPLGDLARQVRRAILQTGSQRKAVKVLKSSGIKINQTKISRIVNNEILPAYAKAGIPVERVFLLRPSISYRKAPIDDEARTDPDLYPNSVENSDG